MKTVRLHTFPCFPSWMTHWLRLFLLLFVSYGLSLTAADGDQGVRALPLPHTSVETATKAVPTQLADPHGTLASTGYSKAPEILRNHDGSVANAAAEEQRRWQQDNGDITTKHRSFEAPGEQPSFGTEPPEGPPRRATRANGAAAMPGVVVKKEGEAEPKVTVKTSAEFAAQNSRDRIKRQTSWDAEKTDKDTDGGCPERELVLRVSSHSSKEEKGPDGDDGGGTGENTTERPRMSPLSRVEGKKMNLESSKEEVDHTYAGHDPSDQHLLYRDLFRDYNKHIRPVEHHDDIITVHFEVALFNVLSVNTKSGTMVTNTEVILIWKDPYLRWNPDFYNQTKYLRVLYSDVWHPDIILYNSADTSYEDSMINTNIIIQHDGTVTLLTHSIFTSVCDMDIQWFPFDQQTCDMIFSSWTMDIHQMLLDMGPSDITRYHPNQEFFLENFYSEQVVDYDPCCKEPFSIISYHIQMQRRVKFALFFFIVPGVLINICALLVFSLPAESGEKVGLGINSMLAMMVFLMAMTENLPPSERLPVAGVYYGVCLILLTFNIVFSVYVLNLSYRGDRGYQVPDWVRKLTVFTARAVFVKIPDFITEAWELDKDDPKEALNSVSELKGFRHVNNINLMKVEPNFHEGIHVFKDPFQRRSIEALEGILQVLTREEQGVHSRASKDQLTEEWKFLSRVVDRFLFIIFTIATFLFNIIILTQSPFGEKFEYCPLGVEMCGEDYELESVEDLIAGGVLSGKH